MNKNPKQVPRALVCLLLAVFLLAAGFPARVASALLQALMVSGPGYEVSISDDSLAHRTSGTLTIKLIVPANTVGSASINLTKTPGLLLTGSYGSISVGISQPQDSWFSFGYTYTMTNSATVPQQINWTVKTIFNSIENNYSGNFTIEVEHTYDGPVVTPPTCTEEGYTTYTCTLCGGRYTDSPIDALGHDWGDWTHDAATYGLTSTHSRICGNDPNHTESSAWSFTNVVTPPTCTEDGYTTYTCTDCGYSYQGNVTPATGHDWGDWTHNAATSGLTSTHSRVCGNDPGHTESSACSFTSVVAPPTCTEAGFTAHTCKTPTCGYSYTDSPIAALGHEPGEWVVIQPATNKKDGLETLSCLRCGALLESRVIPLLSETWPDNTACSYGPRFRDVAPELTDKWYTYTPVDLTRSGVLEVPLIASNRYRIGIARVTVEGGQVSADYEITSDKVQLKEEFMSFLPGLESVESVEPEALSGNAVPFGTPVDVAGLGESGQALFFMRLVITYDIYADGVQWWSMP